MRRRPERAAGRDLSKAHIFWRNQDRYYTTTDYEIPRNCEATPSRERAASFSSDATLSGGVRVGAPHTGLHFPLAGLNRSRRGEYQYKTEEMDRGWVLQTLAYVFKCRRQNDRHLEVLFFPSSCPFSHHTLPIHFSRYKSSRVSTKRKSESFPIALPRPMIRVDNRKK